MGAFVVDDDHPGPDEPTWLASPVLASLRPLEVPPCRDVVVLAPHPDDEVLGAGGLLQALVAAGSDVEVWAVTDGEASHPGVSPAQLGRTRTAEARVALRRLGLAGASRLRLGLGDGHVPEREAELTARLAGRLRAGSLCLAPWERDGHPDHDACGRAAVASAGAGGARVLRYLVWSWHWARPGSDDLPWASCRRLALSQAQVATKRSAIDAFGSQVLPFGPTPAVLPAPVLQRFRRPFEVYVT